MLGPCDPYLSVPKFMKALETDLSVLSTTSGKTHGSPERLAKRHADEVQSVQTKP